MSTLLTALLIIIGIVVLFKIVIPCIIGIIALIVTITTCKKYFKDEDD